jgi:uncharacterized membrane protein YbaN (DUF454 family)
LTKVLRMAGGFFLVILGVLGLILPVMPGWVFLIPGLIILAEEYSWAKGLLNWAKRKADGSTGRKPPE